MGEQTEHPLRRVIAGAKKGCSERSIVTSTFRTAPRRIIILSPLLRVGSRLIRVDHCRSFLNGNVRLVHGSFRYVKPKPISTTGNR